MITFSSGVHYGLGTYAVILSSWFASCLPFEVLKHWLADYRLQPLPDAEKQRRLWWEMLRMVVINFTWLPIATVLASPLLEASFPNISSNEKGWQWSVFRIVVCFVIDDICFYAYHRLFHNFQWLYVRFHRQHHQFVSPFAWSSHAIHPVEMMCQSVGAMLGPMLFAHSWGGMTLWQWWTWLVLRQLQGVLDHTGFDLPLDPLRMIPGVGGTKFHDDHHRYFNCNYASCFSAIDLLFGTAMKDETWW